MKLSTSACKMQNRFQNTRSDIKRTCSSMSHRTMDQLVKKGIVGSLCMSQELLIKNYFKRKKKLFGDKETSSKVRGRFSQLKESSYTKMSHLVSHLLTITKRYILMN